MKLMDQCIIKDCCWLRKKVTFLHYKILSHDLKLLLIPR